MIRGLAVLALASGALAQNLRASVFQSYSSSSVMGSDGQLHSKTHQVNTETSEDGLEKKVSEILCKDGNCQKQVTFMGHGPAFMASMIPPKFYNSLPGMKQHMAFMMDRMQRMNHYVRHHVGQRLMIPMQEVHFLAPQGDHMVEVMPPKEMVITDAPGVGMSAATVSHDSASSDVMLMVSCGALVSATFVIAMLVRSMLVRKAQAREMPLQALGQPLAPEATAEQGLLTAGIARSVATRKPVHAYLQDLYNRAGAPRTEAELATVLLRDVYMSAVQKAVAAQI